MARPVVIIGHHRRRMPLFTVRPIFPEDIARILEIWLKASILAHDFIPAAYWQSNLAAMRDVYLPQSQTWVLCETTSDDPQPESIKGFLSLVDNRLAALFIDPHHWSNGDGSRLMAKAKQLHSELTLSVYKDNKRAVAFYKSHGFIVENEATDENTGRQEFSMRWEAAATKP